MSLQNRGNFHLNVLGAVLLSALLVGVTRVSRKMPRHSAHRQRR